MAVTATPIFPQTIQNYALSFVNADGTTLKTLATGGTNGTKIEWISVSSTDTTARDVQFWLSDGTTNYLLNTITDDITAGFVTSTTVVPKSVFNYQQMGFLTYDANGNKYLYLKSGWSIKVGVLVAVTSAKNVYVIAQGADF